MRPRAALAMRRAALLSLLRREPASCPESTGHCGIVDYDGFAIAAGQYEVNRKYPQFLDGTCGYNGRIENE